MSGGELSAHPTAIAIIGMAGRFPQARTLQAFWHNLVTGVEAISPLSDAELQAAGVDPALYHQEAYVKVAPVLDGIEAFDAPFFQYTPREAEAMDPQHRFFLECAWEALEDAGYGDEQHGGTVGVFAGAGGVVSSYLLAHPALFGATAGVEHIGNDKDFLSTRVSYKLNLRGPSLTIQSACSTSLVAVHQACQSLLAGECDLALAGGVTIRVPQRVGYLYEEGNIFSPDGHCRAFDADAGGTLFGNGVGLVVLKPLANALRDHDTVYAVIRGSALTNDGSDKVSYWATSAEGQARAMVEALAVADVSPDTIGYVETHGTATALGDPVEIFALTQAFRTGTTRTTYCAIGSVKTNIGHLEGAAGIAGLIKTALMLKHATLVPSLNFQRPNPRIPFDTTPFYVSTESRPWVSDHPRRAAVNSLGIGGTNAFVVLEEPPPLAPPPLTARPAHLLTLSAKSAPALQRLAHTYADFLAEPTAPALADLCYTTNRGRTHFAHRLALVAQEHEATRAALLAAAETPRPAASGKPRIAFLFTGQGSQYLGMGKTLYATEPLFRTALDRCAALLAPQLDRPLLDLLWGAEADEPALLHETTYTQPALFALEWALAQLWQAWGIQPEAVIGHSLGEYVAACVAGVFSLEDGLRLVTARARLMGSLPAGGTMVALFGTPPDLTDALSAHTDEIAIAAHNGSHLVLSGTTARLQPLVSRWQSQGHRCEWLNVSHAFHSPLVEPVLAPFRAVLEQIALSPPSRPLISNLSGAVAGTEVATPAYWCDHLRQPVRYAQGVETLAALGLDTFVEIGPRPALLGMGGYPDGSLLAPSLRRNREWETLLGSTAALYERGAALDWENFHPTPRQRVPLPTYPWESQRYWIGDRAGTTRPAPPTPAPLHPLLGHPLRLAGTPERRFQSYLTPTAPDYLGQHWVYDLIVVVGVSYLEMALAAGAYHFKTSQLAVEDVTILKALILPEAGGKTVQLLLTPSEAGAEFQIFSQDSDSADAPWTLHAYGSVRPASDAPPATDLTATRARCPHEVAHEIYYQRLKIFYGPPLRNLERLWQRDDQEALGWVRLPDAYQHDLSAYHLHPALLDACLQAVFALLYKDDPNPDAYVPVGCQRLRFYGRPAGAVWSHVRMYPQRGTQQSATFDVQLLAEDGSLVAAFSHLQLKRASRDALNALRPAAPRPDTHPWLFELAWEPQGILSRPWPALADLAAALPVPAPNDLAPLADALNAASAAAAWHAFARLGWHWQVGDPFTTDALLAALPIAPAHRRQAAHLVTLLHGAGLLRAIAPQQWEAVRHPDAPPLPTQLQSLRERFPDAQAELALFERAASTLAEALRGESDGLQLLFPDADLSEAAQLYGDSPMSQWANDLLRQALTALVSGGGPRPLRVLEIGGGTGGTTAHLLPALPAASTDYLFTDLSPFFTSRAQARFATFPGFHTALFDVERPPEEQSLTAHPFDLIVAANVLHATRDLGESLGHLRRLLAPGGILCLLEGTAPTPWIDLIFGLTEGWWKFSDRERRPAHPLLAPADWQRVLNAAGFADATVLAPAPEGLLFPQAVILARQPADTARPDTAPLLLWGEETLATSLTDQLNALGEAALLLPPDTELTEALHRFPTARALLHLATEYESAPEEPPSLTPPALALVQAVARHPAPPPLWLLTCGAWRVAPDDEPDPTQAPSWGLGRVLRLERPDLTCTLLDCDPQASPAALAEALLSELRSAQPEPQVAHRSGQRHVARLSPARPPAAVAPLALTPEGTYLITGGLGGLGLPLAQRLVERGARSLVLIGRRTPTAEAQRTLDALQARGVTLLTRSVDVTNHAQLSTLLEEIARTLPPLRGLIHAVGVLDDGALVHQTPERFARVMAPKVWGAWHLHHLTRGMALDWVVYFSSVVSLLGNAGQANHAAANGFLDALAAREQAMGRRALSINWGPWAEVGAAADPQVLTHWQRRGIEGMPPQEALDLFERALSLPVTQAAAVAIQWPHFRERTDPLYRRVAPVTAAPHLPTAPATPPAPLPLTALSPQEQQGRLESLVRAQVIEVLGLRPNTALDPHLGFGEMGMDSLTSVEFRNRLQKQLGHSLPVTLAFDYPTIASLSAFLHEQLAPAPGTAAPPPANEEPAPSLDALSATELEALLAQKLDELNF